MGLYFGCTALLSACGGGITSGGPSFDALGLSGQNFIDQYASVAVTDMENMPNSGTATYKGVAAYSSDYSDPDSIIAHAGSLSELELIADFTKSSISGRVYNFKNIDATANVEGQLEVNGLISGNNFTATVNGTTTETYLGDSAVVSYDGSASGNFIGTDSGAIRGTGSVVANAGAKGSGLVWFVWGAENQ